MVYPKSIPAESDTREEAENFSELPWLNKKWRAKFARETILRVEVKILKVNTRAQSGVNNTELIPYSPSLEPASKPRPTATPIPSEVSSASEPPDPALHLPIIRVIKSDTFDAAQSLVSSLPPKSLSKVGVLNMCSDLQPGGGLLNGTMAQEESLCVRSTLYHSLKSKPTFYRIPELSAIYSPDVVIFRSSEPGESKVLLRAEWFFVDVISCAAVKRPDLDEVDDGSGDGMHRKVYAHEKDKEAMTLKNRLIFQLRG